MKFIPRNFILLGTVVKGIVSGIVNIFLIVYCVCCAKSLQSCLTLWDPLDYSLPDSSIYGILWARIQEWVAMPSSRGSYSPRGRTLSLLCLLHWQECSLPLVPPGKIVYKNATDFCIFTVYSWKFIEFIWGLFWDVDFKILHINHIVHR